MDILNQVFSETAVDAGFTFQSVIIRLAAALILGFIVSAVYIFTHRNKHSVESFPITLVVLPVIITLIVMLVGNSIARAFSLAGTFAIIRFRSVPGDPKDITYVLFTLAVGLSCALNQILYGIILAVGVGIVLIILETVRYGSIKGTKKLLKITVPEDLSYQDAFNDILDEYTKDYKLFRIKTVDFGSLFEVQYIITCPNDMNEKEFIDKLRCRNGNLTIMLVMDSPRLEY